MDVLILGGTGNIGPYVVEAARARGLAVTVATRGVTGSPPVAGVRHVVVDREGDLAAIADRDWDVVVDVAAFRPGWVRSLGNALSGRVGRYVFVSSLLAVALPENAAGLLETSPTVPYGGDADPFDPAAPFEYASMKALAEAEAEARFPGRALVLRPGAIVGPGGGMPDGGGSALLYWPLRMALGGEILIPGDADAPVQWVDVRDLAEGAFHLVDRGATGIVNVIGPAGALTWGRMVDDLLPYLAPGGKATWIPRAWLRERGLSVRGNLSYWQEQVQIPGFMRASNDRALAAGVSFRPLAETLRDAVAWYQGLPEERRAERVLTLRGGLDLAESLVLERDILDEWSRRR